MYETSLPCGIDIRVTREGLFAFAFHSWELFTNSAPGSRIPSGRAGSDSDKIVFMNAFLATLYTNLRRYRRMMVTPEAAIYLGMPITQQI
jgi:hypothetical protein